MKKEEKNEFVAWMSEELAKASSTVLADYRGLTVAQMDDLRSKCREAGVSFKVVKNTLMKRVVKGTDREVMQELLEGPTAIAWHNEDPGAAARVLVEFAKNKQNEALEIKGAAVSGKLLDANGVKFVLATLPTREELLGRMAGLVAAGPTKLVRTIAAGPQMLANVLGALKDQREQAGGA